MNTEDLKNAQQLLSEAQEKLDLLKNNTEQLPVREVMVLASSIREKLRNNQTLISVCDNDAAIAQLRKNLLEDIHDWQVKLIKNVVSKISDDTALLGQITDFDKAKNAMSEMIEAEQVKHIFEETESLKLMEGIDDCKKHTATICRVAENCKNGKFLALFIGDFQSGKSSTIDALCDGRHISAIGDGMATSAVLVKVSYGEKESIHVDWRTNEQLTAIFERIKSVIEYDWGAFDLDKRDERIKLANAIEQIRQRENKLIKGQTLKQDDVKFLMFCDLILDFYGKKELQEKMASPLSISNIPDFTRFPKDGEEKWRKKGVKGFTIDDAIFLFIDTVSCTIPSETLKKLNCTVIDSPGLFNSAYDTMVTESAMVAAHAIVYVLPYYKAVGKDVCESLYTIKEKYEDVHNKLFIVNNVDSLRDNTFVDANRQRIKTMFGPEKDVFVYDAKVSYLAQLKRLYDMGLAMVSDYAHLMRAKIKTPIGSEKELHFQTFDEAWDFHIKPYKAAYGTHETSSVDTYLHESGFLDTVSALKAFIEKNKAYAIILSNGLIPMRSELVTIKRTLVKQYIEPYTTSHENMVAKWKTRIANVKKFQEYSTELFQTEVFDSQNDISVCDCLSKEEYRQIFTSDFYAELATSIAEVLYDNKSKFLASQAMRAIREDTTITIVPPRVKFKDDGQFQKVFGDLVTPLIKEKICELISRRMKYVLEMIETGQDGRVSAIFTPTVDKIKLMLEREWEERFKDDKDFKMIDYLSVPRDLKGCVREKTSNEMSGADFTSDLSIGATLLSGVVVQITAVVTGIAAMIAGYIGAILCDPTFTALIVCVLLGIGGAIVSIIAPEYVREKFVEFLVEKVEPKIRTDAQSDFVKIVKDQITAILDRYVKARIVNINKFQNERDVALSHNPDQPDLEEHCFRALEIIDKIAEQVSEYETYKNTYVKK